MTPCNRTSGTIRNSGSSVRNNKGGGEPRVDKADGKTELGKADLVKADLASGKRPTASNLDSTAVSSLLAHSDRASAGAGNRWVSSGAANNASFRNRT